MNVKMYYAFISPETILYKLQPKYFIYIKN